MKYFTNSLSDVERDAARISAKVNRDMRLIWVYKVNNTKFASFAREEPKMLPNLIGVYEAGHTFSEDFLREDMVWALNNMEVYKPEKKHG